MPSLVLLGKQIKEKRRGGRHNAKYPSLNRVKQTNDFFLHFRQLNTFDHPYHIHKYLDNESSTCLLLDISTLITFDKFDKHIQLHIIMIYTGALSGKDPKPGIKIRTLVTRIVPVFWPQHLFKFSRIMALP